MTLVPRLDQVARRAHRPRTTGAGAAREAAPGVVAERMASSGLRPEDLPRGGRALSSLSVLVGIVAATGFIGMRAPLVRAAPGLAAVYETLGLPMNLTGLAFRDVRARVARDGSRKVLVTKGEIVNLRAEENHVPNLALTVRGADGLQRYSWTAPAPKTRLAPGEEVAFRARLAAPPEDGVDVIVRFAGDGAPTADAPDLGELRLTTDGAGGPVSGTPDIPNPAKMP